MNNLSLLEKPITYLKLDCRMYQTLLENSLYIIKDVWILSRKDLKELGFSAKQIQQIIVQMQLIGLDLNKKNYRN